MTIPAWPKSSPPSHTIKLFLGAIFLCAIAGPILQKFGIPIQYYLGLSPHSLSRGFVWTLLTYPFTYQANSLLDLIFRLGMDLLLLWFFGSAVIDRIGSKRFAILFFGATLAGGLAATGALYILHSPFFSGPSPALIALYTAWAILHAKESTHSPFIRFPWLVAILIGGSLLLDLWARQWPTFFADLAGVLFAYFFCITSEKAESSIKWLRPLEQGIHRALERRHASQKPNTESKVFDFRTGEPLLDDDQFMDAMLGRISLHGEESLTPNEKIRMRRISEKKSQKK